VDATCSALGGRRRSPACAVVARRTYPQLLSREHGLFGRANVLIPRDVYRAVLRCGHAMAGRCTGFAASEWTYWAAPYLRGLRRAARGCLACSTASPSPSAFGTPYLSAARESTDAQYLSTRAAYRAKRTCRACYLAALSSMFLHMDSSTDCCDRDRAARCRDCATPAYSVPCAHAQPFFSAYACLLRCRLTTSALRLPTPAAPFIISLDIPYAGCRENRPAFGLVYITFLLPLCLPDYLPSSPFAQPHNILFILPNNICRLRLPDGAPTAPFLRTFYTADDIHFAYCLWT